MGESACILLVEDEAMIRLSMEASLEDSGFSVWCADNGKQAMEMLECSASLEIAALVTDVRLGEGPDGWSLAHRGRELNSGLCVVYVTGDSIAEWPAKGVPESMILQKPFATREIITAVANLLDEAGNYTSG